MISALLIHDTLSAFSQELGPRAVTSLRVLAAVVLVTLVCGLIYVLRNIRSLKAGPSREAETPSPRPNHIIIFVACAVMFAAACVLLFLVAKAGAPI